LKDKIEYLNKRRCADLRKGQVLYECGEIRGKQSLFQLYTQRSLWRQKRKTGRLKQWRNHKWVCNSLMWGVERENEMVPDYPCCSKAWNWPRAACTGG